MNNPGLESNQEQEITLLSSLQWVQRCLPRAKAAGSCCWHICIMMRLSVGEFLHLPPPHMCVPAVWTGTVFAFDVNNSCNAKKLQCSVSCAHNLSHTSYMFRHYYLAVFRELTPKFLENVRH